MSRATATTRCVAVGATAGKPLAESWNGSTFTLQPTPAPSGVEAAGLQSVSCTTSSECTAVGRVLSPHRTGGVIERWDGHRWTLETAPVPGGSVGGPGALQGLTSVSCAGASACTAVGQYPTSTGTVELGIASWSGHAWSPQSAHVAGKGSVLLSSVACSPTACTAAGWMAPPTGSTTALVLRRS